MKGEEVNVWTIYDVATEGGISPSIYLLLSDVGGEFLSVCFASVTDSENKYSLRGFGVYDAVISYPVFKQSFELSRQRYPTVWILTQTLFQLLKDMHSHFFI